MSIKKFRNKAAVFANIRAIESNYKTCLRNLINYCQSFGHDSTPPSLQTTMYPRRGRQIHNEIKSYQQPIEKYHLNKYEYFTRATHRRRSSSRRRANKYKSFETTDGCRRRRPPRLRRRRATSFFIFSSFLVKNNKIMKLICNRVAGITVRRPRPPPLPPRRVRSRPRPPRRPGPLQPRWNTQHEKIITRGQIKKH